MRTASTFRERGGRRLARLQRNRDQLALNAVFGVSRKGITFTLRNKTEGPLKIDWNQWSYVDG